MKRWWLILFVAAPILLVCLIPAGTWERASADGVLRGFDSNLIYQDRSGRGGVDGLIDLTDHSLQMTAFPGSSPTVHFLSSAGDFQLSMNLQIQRNDGGRLPLRLQIWSPRQEAILRVDFQGPPKDLVTAQLVSRGVTTWTAQLGTYTSGSTYHLQVNFDRVGGNVRGTISSTDQPTHMDWLVTAKTAPDLLVPLPVAVTMIASATTGVSSVHLSDYELVLTPGPGSITPIVDGRAHLILEGLAAIAFVVALLGLALRIHARLTSRQHWRFSGIRGWTSWLNGPAWRWVLLAGGGLAGFLIGNAFVFHLGSHTYDMMSEKTFTYVAARYGVSSVYTLPAVTTPAKIWSGTPYAQVPFPYGPTMALFFGGIGWFYRDFMAGARLSLDTVQLEYLIKAFNLAFGMLDGILIFAILRRHASERTAIIGAALFLCNPVTWFLMSVWGETQTVSIALLLASILAFEREAPWAGWFFLATAGLTRPQLLVPCLIVGLAALLRTPVAKSVEGMSWGVVLTFLFLLPVLFSFGPSLPLEYATNTYATETASNPATDAYNYVSNDAYNIWPLVTALVSGQNGHSRLYFPQNKPITQGLSYAVLGNVLFGAVIVGVLLGLVIRSLKNPPDGYYLPFAAAALLGLLVFKTGISAQHFLLALPLVILSRRFFSAAIYYATIGALTVTTFVAMYGSLGFALQGVGQLAPALDPERNPVTRYFMNLFVSDRFITIASISNAMALAAALGAAAITFYPRPTPSKALVPARPEDLALSRIN